MFLAVEKKIRWHRLKCNDWIKAGGELNERRQEPNLIILRSDGIQFQIQ